jgi:hypothetical protein
MRTKGPVYNDIPVIDELSGLIDVSEKATSSSTESSIRVLSKTN